MIVRDVLRRGLDSVSGHTDQYRCGGTRSEGCGVWGESDECLGKDCIRHSIDCGVCYQNAE